MILLDGISRIGWFAESLEMTLFDWFQLDLFDLLFVMTAVVFNLQIMGIYIASRQDRKDVVRRLGMAVIALSLPFAVVFLNNLIDGKERWIMIGFLLIFLYLLVELIFDFILKIEFRDKPILHIPYVILFYMVEIALTSIAFSISAVSGYLVSISFWALLACLIYAYWPRRKGSYSAEN